MSYGCCGKKPCGSSQESRGEERGDDDTGERFTAIVRAGESLTGIVIAALLATGFL